MRIVPRLDEVEDGGFSLALGSEAILHEELAFERGVKALAHRIVEAIAARIHRRSNAADLQRSPKAIDVYCDP